MVKRVPIAPQFITRFVLLARYHKPNPLPSDRVFCSLKQIGDFLKLSPTSIRLICMKYFSSHFSKDENPKKMSKRIQKKLAKRKQCFGVLSCEHIMFLTSQDTLRK